METIVRNVSDIDMRDRQALEHVVGQELRDDQQVMISVIDSAGPQATPGAGDGGNTLPEWCHVYAGLSEDEIADLERTVLSRADFSRPAK